MYQVILEKIVSWYSPAILRSNQQIRGKMNDEVYSYMGGIEIVITEIH